MRRIALTFVLMGLGLAYSRAAPNPMLVGSCCTCQLVETPEGPAWSCPCTAPTGGYSCTISQSGCNINTPPFCH